MLDDLTEAVLSREEIVRYLHGSHGESGLQVRDRICGYLEELRTTQRYPIYRALKHPLYPILRKIERLTEGIEIPQQATATGRVLYASNHRSHIDYLVEPLALDEHGIRPPIMAAGINLFGGALGLLHRHVTGALPIRRNTKDPVYLITLKAYVAELLHRHDLMLLYRRRPELQRRAEGAEDRPDPCGAPGRAHRPGGGPLRGGVQRRDRGFHPGPAEDQALATELRPRAGGDGPLWRWLQITGVCDLRRGDPRGRLDPHSRSDVLDLAHRTRQAIGLLAKVLPTAVVAAAMRPSITRRELEIRVAEIIDVLAATGANMGVFEPTRAVERAARDFVARGMLVLERGRFRIRERTVLRYYARSIEHLLHAPAGRTH